MTLKILTPTKKVRKCIEVVSFDEAKKLMDLHIKSGDTCYVQVASKMTTAPLQKRYTSIFENQQVVRADNGRILSKAEIRNKQLSAL